MAIPIIEHKIAAETRLGSVHLTVSDLARSLDYYQDGLGLRIHRQEESTAALGAGNADLLVLSEVPGAVRHPRTSGLYHFALLLPGRLELARFLRHLVESDTPLGGASDHLVSEALYLSDPDGNGIEVYCDRPRETWQFQRGQVRMTVDPLDANGLMALLGEDPATWSGLHPDTVLGHMHLHVADLAAGIDFYTRAIGFDLMTTYGGSAAFLSAGGYHHHLGINTWNGAGAPPPPAGSVGLRHFSVLLPNQDEMNALTNRLEAAGVGYEENDSVLIVKDPSENVLHFTVNPESTN